MLSSKSYFCWSARYSPERIADESAEDAAGRFARAKNLDQNDWVRVVEEDATVVHHVFITISSKLEEE